MAMGTELVSQGTHIEGVELRVSDMAVEVSRETVRRLYDLARRYVVNAALAQRLKKRQDELRARIIAITEAHGAAIRGVRSERDDFQVLIVREVEESWDAELLKAALGALYPNLVSEQFTASVTIPMRQEVSAEDLTKALREFLVSHGVPEKEVGRFLETDVDLLADTDRVRELAHTGKITLPEGTRVEGVSWTIKPLPLKVSAKTRKKRTS
ncbi:hypothetical protein HYW67_03730 [Candidatus Parcubacteria bacterium]|nr:hypothetical protein [Candidatus Parcubacteria bacterium]